MIIRLKLIFLILKILLAIEKKSMSTEEKVIHIYGEKVSYIKRGSGKHVVVFIHGWAQSKDTWIKILKTMSQKKYTSYALDLPGFGNSTLSHPLSLQEYAKVVHRFMTVMNIQHCTMIGHSFGGKVATQVAIDYPGKILKLVLYSVSLQLEEKRNRFIDFALSIVSSRIVLFIIKAYFAFRKFSYGRFFILLETYRKTHTKLGFENRLKQLKVQTLLIYGALDFVVPIEEARRIRATVKNTASLKVFENSSHIAHIEEEKRFIKVVGMDA